MQARACLGLHGALANQWRLIVPPAALTSLLRVALRGLPKSTSCEEDRSKAWKSLACTFLGALGVPFKRRVALPNIKQAGPRGVG